MSRALLMSLATAPSAEETEFRSLFADDPEMLRYQNSLMSLRKCLVHFRLYVRSEVASFMAALSGPMGFTAAVIDTEGSSISLNVRRQLIETLKRIEDEIKNMSSLSEAAGSALFDSCQFEIDSILKDNEFKNLAKKSLFFEKERNSSKILDQREESLLESIKQYLK